MALALNLQLVDAPGNVVVSKHASGLPRDSLANVAQVVTVDRVALIERAGQLSGGLLAAVDAGLRLHLSL